MNPTITEAPEPENFPQLTEEEASKYLDRMEKGDLSATYLLAYDALIYHENDAKLIKNINSHILLNLRMDDPDILVDLARLFAHYEQYQTAYSIIDYLLENNRLRPAYWMYYQTFKSEDKEVARKAIYYLDKAADGGYFYALHRRKSIRYKKYGPLRFPLLFLFKLTLFRQITYLSLNRPHDPRIEGMREVGLKRYNLVAKTLRFSVQWLR